jgi:nitronate monooxygenase
MVPNEPAIIQGGMGVAVSGWRLARAVSQAGQLGVVSGTAIDVVMTRRLQMGDPGGHVRRALAEFPYPEMAQRVLDQYFIPGGKAPNARFKQAQMITHQPNQEQLERVVLGNFVEIHLAKEDHDGLVGVNYLEKIQSPTLPSLFGAMLARVDYVIMGAGIPRSIPGALDKLANGEPFDLPLHVNGARPDEKHTVHFDPRAFTGGDIPWLERPKFLAIIASATLASMLSKKANGHVDGWVIEGPTAGGHNAPPRGDLQLNERGEPIYGERDVVDLAAIRAIGRPFWLAGSYGTPEKLVEAWEAGAAGIQVGTAFAFCEESGLRDDIKQRVLAMSREDAVDVFTDPVGSPAGFPFKVLRLAGSISEREVYEQRERRCDLGFLRQAYRKEDGSLGWRCPADRIELYVRKGGRIEDTVGRKCVCNGLVANIGLPQIQQNGEPEKPIVTCGDEARSVARFLKPGATRYSARDVIAHLLSGAEPARAPTTELVTSA